MYRYGTAMFKMSRNLRHKSNATPTKKTVRRRSTATVTTSEDEGYSGVDDISADEEDEPDVEQAEEEALIDEEDELSTPRPSIDDEQSNWEGIESDTQEEVLGENVQFFEDHMARGRAPDQFTAATAGHTISGLSDDEPDAARRVRFDLSSDSSSTISDNDDNLFPDLFVEQSRLDPSFLKAIENGEDDNLGGSSDGEGSYWDFTGEDPGLEGLPFVPLEDDDDADDDNKSMSSIGSSGYETDEGETTEEDLPPAAKYIGLGRSVLRRASTDSGSEEEITIARRSSFRDENGSRQEGRGPRMGSWIRDRTKPFVLMGTDGKKLYMFKAEIDRRRFSFNGTSSSRQQAAFALESDAETPTQELSPMISNSGNLMMSAMYNPIDQILMGGGEALGPPEAFFPFTTIEANGNIVQDDPSSYDEDDVDDEDLWRIEDFFEFGTGESANGDDEQDDSAFPSSTPARPMTAPSDDEMNPLSHLKNPSAVGAFRTNQETHRLLSSNKATHASLAFSGPLNQGTLRGIKDNRLAAANAPITPMRKQKSRANIPSSPGSPLVQHQQNKRKFTNGFSDQVGHKRSKSLI